MSKICARCDKTVYPIEELKCLDKLWHKSCFKCYECGMILNMKTYKGFNKLPYCNAHTPVARATTVVDTPETRRLAENTKIQSQAKYHADFEKQKGKLTQVADDPETLRIRNQSKIISNATYHGEYEKKKQMEERRGMLENENNNVSTVVYHSVTKNEMVPKNVPPYEPNVNNNNMNSINNNVTIQHQSKQQQQHQVHHQPMIKTINPNVGVKIPTTVMTPSSQSINYVNDPRYAQMAVAAQQQQQQQYHIQQQQQAHQYHHQVPSSHQIHHQQQSQPQPTVYHDNNQYYSGRIPVQHSQKQFVSANLGRCFRAIYDYTAQDVDEVSFIDGDLVINCQPIDDGWMTGTVQRTGKTGMLPSNYVESV
ncbi:hypothetical protein RDWZM_004384 [Blomia tropicalis]|uniref:LIM and SH3 domain protein Lasp n=1 Tax=Blomia tropicalis TaxID=40697 RepID=A0A9Q0MHC6_BLOTA|nr:hypothetical protein RDWZM_004384 [Blomia tropicalis]